MMLNMSLHIYLFLHECFLILQSIVQNIKLPCFSQSGCHYKTEKSFYPLFNHTKIQFAHTHTHTLSHPHTQHIYIYNECTYTLIQHTQHTHTHTHWYTQLPNKMHICRYTYAHPCVYVCTHTHTYTHTCTHTLGMKNITIYRYIAIFITAIQYY